LRARARAQGASSSAVLRRFVLAYFARRCKAAAPPSDKGSILMKILALFIALCTTTPVLGAQPDPIGPNNAHAKIMPSKLGDCITTKIAMLNINDRGWTKLHSTVK
jgi:hypothetical protein